MAKHYTLTRPAGGPLELRAEQLIYELDQKKRPTGASHVETEITSKGYDTGNASEETAALALAIMRHYYGASDADPGAKAEAIRKAPLFRNAFLIHHNMPPGSRLEISSDVIDRWTSLL